MRLKILLAFLLAFATAVFAWEKEDHEIFDLVSALEAAEGKGTTFYSWLNVSPQATTAEIVKSYRKMSIAMHPDKNPGVKGIHERFARLGVIVSILKNQAFRERYDFFFKNGVPKWRGTGYYYSRFRPGLGSVLIFLTILTSIMQYLVQRINHKRDLNRIETVTQAARAAAWGPKMIPIEGKRKVKIPLGGPRHMDEDGYFREGKIIEMVVEGQHVYIVGSTGELQPLDTDAAVPPSIASTWFCVLVVSLFRKFIPRSSYPTVPDTSDEDESSSSETAGNSTVISKSEDTLKVGRAGAAKTSGRRRKAVTRR